MLSYMLPVEDKPPPAPPKAMKLNLTNGRAASTPVGVTSGTPTRVAANGTPTRAAPANGKPATPISKETSVSSFISDATTATASSMTPTSTSTDKGRPKLVVNGKHQSLKRVSFGSSKGSMVETLIFESPLQEEPEPSPIPEKGPPFGKEHEQNEAERERVRVTFFQQSKPLEVDLPDDSLFLETDFMMASPTLNDSNHVAYNRIESTESGWDNPFRPGGDLSREADEIVELIKGGKPITPTPGSQAPPLPTADQSDGAANHAAPAAEPAAAPKAAAPANQRAPPAPRTNGAAPKGAEPGAVEVRRDTVKADDGTRAERVTIKKKPKCECCVIQ